MASLLRGLQGSSGGGGSSSGSGGSKSKDAVKFAIEAVLTKPFTTIGAYLEFWESMDAHNATSFFAALGLKVLAAAAKPTGRKDSTDSEIVLGARARPTHTWAQTPAGPDHPLRLTPSARSPPNHD